MSKFLPTSGFKWIDPKELDLNKYTSNSLKGCVLKVNLDYPKDLRNYTMIIIMHQVNTNQKRNVVRLSIKDC